MDIYCPICGEPWDMDALHEEVAWRWPDSPWDDPHVALEHLGTVGEMLGMAPPRSYDSAYSRVKHDFYARGCKAMTHCGTADDMSWCVPPERTDDRLTRADAAAAMYDLMGDDLDGCAAMLEDGEFFGLFD